MPDGGISHDRTTRFPADGRYASKDLRKQVEPVVCGVGSDEGVLIFGDGTREKPQTDENGLIRPHCDRYKGRDVKGIMSLQC